MMKDAHRRQRQVRHLWPQSKEKRREKNETKQKRDADIRNRSGASHDVKRKKTR